VNNGGIFVWVMVGLFGFLFVLVILLGLFYPGSGADQVDWKPTRSPEVEAQNEVDDIQQMLDAQNEYRRRRGAREITEADVQRQAQQDQAVRARGSGPFSQRSVIDELDDDAPKRTPRKAKPKPKSKRKK
jgi:hypothetical protein